jgi:putative endonuclease
MTEERLSLGRWGEEEAARFLRRLGMTIVERNLRTPVGEIDIIARQGKILVFVEVKTRRSDAFGTPQEAVGPTKQRQIIRTALWFAFGLGVGADRPRSVRPRHRDHHEDRNGDRPRDRQLGLRNDHGAAGSAAREHEGGDDHADPGGQRRPSVRGQQPDRCQQSTAADDRQHEPEREPAEGVGVGDRPGEAVHGSDDEGHHPGRDARSANEQAVSRGRRAF